MDDDETPVRISCRDCSFERVVDSDGDEKPADVLIQHGQRTGHTLKISHVDGKDG